MNNHFGMRKQSTQTQNTLLPQKGLTWNDVSPFVLHPLLHGTTTRLSQLDRQTDRLYSSDNPTLTCIKLETQVHNDVGRIIRGKHFNSCLTLNFLHCSDERGIAACIKHHASKFVEIARVRVLMTCSTQCNATPLHVCTEHKILREIERAKQGAQKSAVTVGKRRPQMLL